MTYDELADVVRNPDYHRVRTVVKHLFNGGGYSCDLGRMLRGSDRRGKSAILAIIQDYANNFEDGWILPLSKLAFECEPPDIPER